MGAELELCCVSMHVCLGWRGLRLAFIWLCLSVISYFLCFLNCAWQKSQLLVLRDESTVQCGDVSVPFIIKSRCNGCSAVLVLLLFPDFFHSFLSVCLSAFLSLSLPILLSFSLPLSLYIFIYFIQPFRKSLKECLLKFSGFPFAKFSSA